MYPPGCGVVSNWIPFKQETELLTDRLQQCGYNTAICGKLHFVPHEEPFGFEHRRMNDAPYSIYANDDKYSDYIAWLRERWTGEADPVTLFDEDESAFQQDDWHRFILGSNFRQEHEHDIPWVAHESIEFLRTRDKSRPFFLFTSFFGPHQPFQAPAPWNTRYAPADVSLPPQFDADMTHCPIFQVQCAERASQFRQTWSEPIYRELIAAYYGQVAMIDHYVGQLLGYLRQENLWDDTLIVFCSDHGDHNGAYGLFFKGQMYDSCCKVPLIVKPQGPATKGRVRDEIVNTLDLYGTLLDAAGDTNWQQPHIEARSLTSLLQEQALKGWDNQTFSIIGRDPSHSLTMLRRDDFKLMRLGRGDNEPLYELYDMRDEIVEVRNVFDDLGTCDIKGELRGALDAWSRQQSQNYPDEIMSYAKI